MIFELIYNNIINIKQTNKNPIKKTKSSFESTKVKRMKAILVLDKQIICCDK